LFVVEQNLMSLGCPSIPPHVHGCTGVCTLYALYYILTHRGVKSPE